MSNFYFVYYLNVLIPVIFSVAFYTLAERKILSYQQNRKGPNVMIFHGILQPVSDALKLMTKMEFFFSFGNIFFYWFFPFVSFSMMLFLWMFFYLVSGTSEFNYSIFFFFIFIGISGYGLIMTAWSSNSKYSVMGGYRGLAQTISYEVILFLSLFIFFNFFNTFNYKYLNYSFSIFLFWIVFFIFCFSLVCEVNRAPFDLAEGESELVSGFNVEYGSLKFAVIFLSEYGMMIFMSYFMSLFFFFNYLFLMVFLLIFMYFFLWLRSSYPRFRFDMLMEFAWKNLIMLLIFFMFFFLLIL